MSSEFKGRREQIEELMRRHERATADFRAGLSERNVGEVIYDDYLLVQMRKGKPFKIALRKANKKFPVEAQNPSAEDFAKAEEFYGLFLRMTRLDEDMQKLKELSQLIQEKDRQIEDIDKKIANLIEPAGENQG